MRRALLAAATLTLAGARAGSVHASPLDHLALRIESGGGTMLSHYQRQELRYFVAVQGSVRPAIHLWGPFSVEGAFSSWWFPSPDVGDYGRVSMVGGGLRLGFGGFFLDGHAGKGLTSGPDRLLVDGGLGFEFELAPVFALAPCVRYAQFIIPDTGALEDAKFWSVGVQITLRLPPGPPPPPPNPLPPMTPMAPLPELPPPPTPAPPPAPVARPRPVDSDGDGVLDLDDRCPTVPHGGAADPERPGCPDGDDDADGFLDHGDQCRGQAAGLKPDPTRPGCPFPDRDGDMVPDVVDACPDKAGAPSEDPKKNGCPGLVQIAGGQIRINQIVYFETGKARIRSRSFPLLSAVADALKATPEIRRLAVHGHTDNQGNPTTNLNLSGQRAESVRAWLVKRGGIDAARLEAQGFGAGRPLGSNKTSRGRAENRRVEFVIVDPAGPATSP